MGKTEANDMNQIATKQDLLPAEQITPMTMLQMAVSQGADLDKLEKLMQLQERWEANEARKAYVVAMNAFKANPPTIFKTKNVSFNTTTYNHALLENAAELIGAELTKHGLSFRWDCEQLEGGIVRVTCVLTHCQGHSERTALQAGLDQSGGKNNIQALGSTVSYLERYTLFAATGMAAKGMDDDGKGSETFITDQQAADLKALAEEVGASVPDLLEWLAKKGKVSIKTVEDIPANMHKEAVAALERKRAKAAK